MKSTKKEEQALWECYRRLFKASEPSANFDELVANATINDQGQKVIDFMAHEIDEDVYEQILKDVLKEFKISKHRSRAFSISIALGCSPKFKSRKA